MKVVKKKVEEGKFQLDCIATAQEVNQCFYEASVEFANQLGLKPQQNVTPDAAIAEKLGVKDVDSLTRARAIELMVPIALNKVNIIPMYPPKPLATSDFKRGQEFAFSVRISPKPDYELSSYEPVSITVQKQEYDLSGVDEQLKQMAEQYGEYVTAEPKPIEKGDVACISLYAIQDGKPLTALNTDGRPYTAGEGYMPEGFDEAILGMCPGETKKFTFEAPDFDEDFNEITVTVDCEVTIKEIQKKVTAEITDEWVERNMPMFGGLQNLKDMMSAQIKAQQDRMYKNYVTNIAVEELAKRFQGKIEDGAYEATSKALKEQIVAQAAQNNMTWDQFVEANGGEQQVNIMMMMQTRQQLVQGFSLDALFRAKKLVVSEEDIREACISMGATEANYKQFKKQLEDSNRDFLLREAAERAKAARYLVDNANITIAGEELLETEEKAEANEG